ncbi:hypothetical protein KSP40_PGU006965 [Platanthera guangdongensis]|uniref:Uncharacterized protein n=1 Tax=Platanthera guangdongensis TaxID=2320717 RepID=A0ABR2LMW0_9ASPA
MSTSNLEGSAKATVEDQICQAVKSTSNLLHLMQEASPSQLKKDLTRKKIKNKEEDSAAVAQGRLNRNGDLRQR